jgi:hypothetical protein
VQAYEIVETDLSKEEAGSPTARADVAIGLVRQTHELTASLGDLCLRTASDEPVRSPSGIATAGLKTATAGFVAAAPFDVTGYLLDAPGWLTLTLAMLAFLLIVLGIAFLVVIEEIRQGDTQRGHRPAGDQPQAEG